MRFTVVHSSVVKLLSLSLELHTPSSSRDFAEKNLHQTCGESWIFSFPNFQRKKKNTSFVVENAKAWCNINTQERGKEGNVKKKVPETKMVWPEEPMPSKLWLGSKENKLKAKSMENPRTWPLLVRRLGSRPTPPTEFGKQVALGTH